VDCLKNVNRLVLFIIHTEVNMKNLLLVVVATMMAATLSVSAWADAPVVPAPAAASAVAGASGEQHPCHAIEAACKGAGFVKGGAAQGKGLWKDCIKPVLDGNAVSGVNVGAD
jgi:hypothetical protein